MRGSKTINIFMKYKFRIRKARKEDKPQVKEVLAHSIANRKNLFSPTSVASVYIDEFVNKAIERGDMILVENHENELELIGEVHYYYNGQTSEKDGYSREITFFSKIDRTNTSEGNELIEWLYGEIEQNHTDVFSVELMAPVLNIDSVNSYKDKGISVETNYNGRLKCGKQGVHTFLPLSWVNPSFN